MGYAITETGWRAVGPEHELAPDETYVETLPDWLIEAAQKAEVARSSQSTANQLRQFADEKISPLQAAVDIDEVSEEDRAIWRSWKRYLIALSKTPERPGWPEQPDWPTPPES